MIIQLGALIGCIVSPKVRNVLLKGKQGQDGGDLEVGPDEGSSAVVSEQPRVNEHSADAAEDGGADGYLDVAKAADEDREGSEGSDYEPVDEMEQQEGRGAPPLRAQQQHDEDEGGNEEMG